MKIKHICRVFLSLGIIFASVFYFNFFGYSIGEPTSITIKYWNLKNSCYQEIRLNEYQKEQFLLYWGKTKPTLFYYATDGINNEDVIITFNYSDMKPRSFTLWSNDDVIYEGRAENLTMSAMHGENFHFAGKLTPEMKLYLKRICQR